MTAMGSLGVARSINFLLKGVSAPASQTRSQGMASEGRDYFLARATEERSAAASAPNAAIARTHNDLAAMYDRMAREAEREPEPA